MSWPAIDLTGKRLAGKRPPANVWPALGRRANGWPAYGGEHLSPRRTATKGKEDILCLLSF